MNDKKRVLYRRELALEVGLTQLKKGPISHQVTLKIYIFKKKYEQKSLTLSLLKVTYVNTFFTYTSALKVTVVDIKISKILHSFL